MTDESVELDGDRGEIGGGDRGRERGEPPMRECEESWKPVKLARGHNSLFIEGQ